MGNNLCRVDIDVETQQSINIARNYFHVIDSNLERDGTGKIHKIKESQIYKQKLVELIKYKKEMNQKAGERKQETYLIPFLEIAYNTNQTKYEYLVLNMKSAQKKMDQIIKQKETKLRNKEILEIRQREQYELDDLLNKMALHEYNQVLHKKIKKQDNSLLQSQCNQLTYNLSHYNNQLKENDQNTQIVYQDAMEKQAMNSNIESLFHTKSNEFPKANQNQQITFQKSMSADSQNQNGISQCRPSFGRGSNFCQSQIQGERVQYSILDVYKNYESGLIASQQYLLNYLYEKVSKDEHIVKSLIDKFGELISEKFSPIFNQYDNFDIIDYNLTQSSIDCYEKISEIVKEDIIFLIDLLKDYLLQIYGEKVIPPNTMNEKQKDNVFDLFVRKVVFDNEKICEIAFRAIDISSISQNNKLRLFKKDAAKYLNIQNAFLQEKDLSFLSQCDENPFAELDKWLENIKHLSSPYLKIVNIQNFRTHVKFKVDKLYKEMVNGQKSIQFSVDQMALIEYFIFLISRIEIYNDLIFIKTYAKQSEIGNEYVDWWSDIHEEFLESDIKELLDRVFFNSGNKIQEIQQQPMIKEESESLSEYSRISQTDLQLQFNHNKNIQKQLNQQIAINYAHSMSSHTITEICQDLPILEQNINQVYSQSDIISTISKKTEAPSLRDNNEAVKESFELNLDCQQKNNKSKQQKSTFLGENQQMISTNAHAHESFQYDADEVIEDENKNLNQK